MEIENKNEEDLSNHSTPNPQPPGSHLVSNRSAPGWTNSRRMGGGGQAGEMQRGAHMQPPGTRGTGLRVVSGDTRANAGGKDTAEAWMVAGLVGIFGGSVGWCVWGKTHLPNPFQGGGGHWTKNVSFNLANCKTKRPNFSFRSKLLCISCNFFV